MDQTCDEERQDQSLNHSSVFSFIQSLTGEDTPAALKFISWI
jgi:hypothetical protein